MQTKTRAIGVCRSCGGLVAVPTVWKELTEPIPVCRSCGATPNPPKTIRVEVTKKLIAAGKKLAVDDDDYQNTCPVALALLDKLNLKMGEVGVGSGHAVINDGSTYKIPMRLRRWINNLDDGYAVKPITATLRFIGYD